MQLLPRLLSKPEFVAEGKALRPSHRLITTLQALDLQPKKQPTRQLARQLVSVD